MHTKTMERSDRTVTAGPEPLMSLRGQIDRVDDDLVRALAARLRLAEEVGTLKRYTGLLPLDPRREAEVVRRACEVARYGSCLGSSVSDATRPSARAVRPSLNDG